MGHPRSYTIRRVIGAVTEVDQLVYLLDNPTLSLYFSPANETNVVDATSCETQQLLINYFPTSVTTLVTNLITLTLTHLFLAFPQRSRESWLT